MRAVAHKAARAVFHMLTTNQEFYIERALQIVLPTSLSY